MPLSKILSTGIRNLAMNGAMQIAQRARSGTGLGTDTAAVFVVDRTFTASDSAGRYTASQNTVTDLAGFTKSLKLECTTADTSIAAGEYFLLQHRWEGRDLQHLKKGTSDAETLTLSFYVKGNAAATYTAELYDYDNNRTFSQRFNVTTSWNRISLTYAGDTTGTYDNDSALSLILLIWLHSGSTYNSGTQNSGWAAVAQDTRANSSDTSFFDSTSRTFEITGLQLEIGDVATDFEHRSFEDELRRCKRYFQKSFAYDTAPANDIAGVRTSEMPPSDSISYAGAIVYLEKTMRATPTCQAYNPQAAPANSGAYVNDLVNGSVTTEYAVSSVSASSSKLRFFLTTAPTIGGNPYGCNWTAQAEL
mgnify:CR=1 FL=1